MTKRYSAVRRPRSSYVSDEFACAHFIQFATPPIWKMDKPLYRVSDDPHWLAQTVSRAEHLFVKDENGDISCARHGRDAAQCVPRATSDLVWCNTLDNGTYQATVTRVGPYRGRLIITRDDKIVRERAVGIMYDAPFGPDVEDVRAWEAVAEAAADEDYKRRGKRPPS